MSILADVAVAAVSASLAMTAFEFAWFEADVAAAEPDAAAESRRHLG